MTTKFKTKLASAISLIQACSINLGIFDYEDIKDHLDAPVSAAMLRKAERTRGGLADLADCHALYEELMLPFCGLTRPTVQAALDTMVVVACERGFPKRLRHRAVLAVAIFLSSRWRPVALEATRSLQEVIKQPRKRHARANAKNPRICVALLAIVADPDASHADRAWALRQIEFCSEPLVTAVQIFLDLPGEVLASAEDGTWGGNAFHMLRQSAVLENAAWVERLMPHCTMYRRFEVPAEALRRLPHPSNVLLARQYVEQHLLSDPRVAAEWVNSFDFQFTMKPALRTPDVLLKLLTLPGVNADRRGLLVEWFGVASEVQLVERRVA